MNHHLLHKLLLLLFVFSGFTAHATQNDEIQISNFIVKENLLQNAKLAILACDSLDIPQEQINGTFQFAINGFNYPLNFRDGVAITPNKIENSTFVYLQHKNSSGTHSSLFYVLKKDTGLKIYKISWFLLILVPISLLVLMMLFKRFVWIAIIIFGIYLYYNAQKGLAITSFFEIIMEGIKSFF